MAKAIIGPTPNASSDRWGIVWRDFVPLQRRGGYSGSYDSKEAAEEGARNWADSYEEVLEFEYVPDLSDVETEPLPW